MWVGGVPPQPRFSIPRNLNSSIFTSFTGCVTDLQFADDGGSLVRLPFIGSLDSK